jgi:hypothetical protein
MTPQQIPIPLQSKRSSLIGIASVILQKGDDFIHTLCARIGIADKDAMSEWAISDAIQRNPGTSVSGVLVDIILPEDRFPTINDSECPIVGPAPSPCENGEFPLDWPRNEVCSYSLGPNFSASLPLASWDVPESPNEYRHAASEIDDQLCQH